VTGTVPASPTERNPLFETPFDSLDTPLTPEESARWIDKAARQVVDRGLSIPAILTLEMHRPIAFTLGQGMVAATPLLGPLLGLDRMSGITRVLCAPGGVDSLIRRIEELNEMKGEPASEAGADSEPQSL
jgi:hypothetical protein